jgi:hypothetical protein
VPKKDLAKSAGPLLFHRVPRDRINRAAQAADTGIFNPLIQNVY